MISDKVFGEVMQGLQELYNVELNAFTLKLYKSVFDKNFNDDGLFQEAVMKLIETRVYPTMPKPAEFMEVIKPNKLDLDSRSLLAANKLKKAIRGIGKYESVAFDDYLIHKVIKASYGSWVKICKVDMEELETFLKWDFPKLYKTYATYKNLNDIPIYLVGSHESQNVALQTTPTIKYIGDKQKALKWQIAISKSNNLLELEDHQQISADKKLVALGFKEEIKVIKNNNIDVKKLIDEGKEKFKVDTPREKESKLKTKEELYFVLRG